MLANSQIHPVSTGERLLRGIALATNALLTLENEQSAIQAALAAVGSALDVDRIYIFENHPHPDTSQLAISQRWEWTAPGITPEMNNPELQNLVYDDVLPRWYDILSQAKPVVGLIKHFPATEQALLVPQGIQSILVVPIFIRDHFWGFAGFDDCRQERDWTEATQAALLALAGNIGGAIAQRQAETNLRQINATLEERVQTRTIELQAAKEKAETALANLARTQSQLVHQEKLSLMGQMVAGLVHEINNPLNFIMANIDYCQDYTDQLCMTIAQLREYYLHEAGARLMIDRYSKPSKRL